MAAPLPKVSVIMPAFNAAQFIERALASALEQEGVEVEVVIVDDGSTDGTGDLVERLSKADPRIRLLRLDRNKGPSVARNTALDAAEGEWIAILDADDAYCQGRLRHLVEVGQRYEADLVADNFYFYDADTDQCSAPALAEHPPLQRLSVHEFVDRARAGHDEADFGLLKPVLRSHFVDRHHLRYSVRSRHGEDFLFVLDAMVKGAAFLLSRQPGYLYTMRSSGFSRTRIDYRQMAEETRALAGRSEIARDRRLRRLILERSSAIRWLDARRIVRVLLAERRIGELLVEATKRPRVAASLVRACWARARQLVPRPHRKAGGENEPS
jgi:succinoglycan biosynthesis protein ExoO